MLLKDLFTTILVYVDDIILAIMIRKRLIELNNI